MEEIKVGEYVRINNDMRAICIGIGKVIRIVQETIYVDMRNDLPISFQKSQVAKHSFNIIDLIEVGDFVNGHLVKELPLMHNEIMWNDWENGFKTAKGVVGWPIENNKDGYIKTILTKEQYEEYCYKVEV